jgi:CP family cyanate transporter-like MFS transporter
VLVLAVTGWFMTRERYADDEVNRFVAGWSSTAHCEDVLETAGTEPPVSVHVRTDDGSPRG